MFDIIMGLIGLLVCAFILFAFAQSKKTSAGFWNVWVETEEINDGQIVTVTKYCIHKWCYLKITKWSTDLGFLKDN